MLSPLIIWKLFSAITLGAEDSSLKLFLAILEVHGLFQQNSECHPHNWREAYLLI